LAGAKTHCSELTYRRLDGVFIPNLKIDIIGVFSYILYGIAAALGKLASLFQATFTLFLLLFIDCTFSYRIFSIEITFFALQKNINHTCCIEYIFRKINKKVKK
jgi:hypothetical protein